MLDRWLDDLERIRARGAVVLIKFDGERTSRTCTFLITHATTGFSYRRDTDDLDSAIAEGLAAYWDAQEDDR